MSIRTIIVGLSGGVDSAVAALILKRQGYEVTGVFMKNWDEDDGTEYCTAIADYEDAQRIADRIKIPLLTVNFAAEYWERVFEIFLHEYRNGRTPNPDVLCNSEIKFDLFLKFALSHGSSEIATGHYACARREHDGFALYRASDCEKDQTYFLHAVPRKKLAQTQLPLAEMYKSDVRTIAKENGIHVFDRKDSTGICFIGERRFDDFLKRYVDRTPGPIVGTGGQTLGEHQGLAFFTLGQRRGIGIGGLQGRCEAPWYVLEKRVKDNTLVITQRDVDLFSSTLVTDTPNWLINEPMSITKCLGMIRYRQQPSSCLVEHGRGSIRVHFNEPQRAITPGQYVVLYDEKRCLGGARIEVVIK